MEPIRTALIGYGKVAHLHAQVLQAIPEAALVAVWGRDAAKAEAFAARYGIQPYTDLVEMIDRQRIQAAIICTPHPAHAEPGVIAAAHGVHVLIEKPMAASLADCDAILAAARASGVKVGVISQRRFYEPVLRMRAAIDAGKIGSPILGHVVMYSWRDEGYYQSDPWRGQWRAEGGGVLVNQSPHQFDLLHWLMGPVDELFGYWGNLNHPYIEVDDTAVAVIRFKNGGMGNLIVSNSQKPGIYGRIHIHGSNGSSMGVQTEGGAMFIAGMTTVQEPPFNDLWTIPGEEHLLDHWRAEDAAQFERIDATTHYLGLQDRDFLRAIHEDRAPAVTGEDGRATVELFTAIYRAQRDHMPVKFPLDSVNGAADFDGRLTPR